ncbi:hypothetical protein OLMES_3961 [Oleiphilus messinensis]|uniref:Uncharacterized protein n=1 Tax=Oleiphilus messinensis TaxID=141451 RepID=A0A1Y0ICJ6_9GAMM|nr:hypothetical protein OLMES_3961 [Oleiphilus messinensis]
MLVFLAQAKLRMIFQVLYRQNFLKSRHSYYNCRYEQFFSGDLDDTRLSPRLCVVLYPTGFKFSSVSESRSALGARWLDMLSLLILFK